MSASHREAPRLDSWKEIAGYLKRDVRTVQRWEHTKGLPVHRIGEGKRVPIYALRSELDEWWRTAASLDPETPRKTRWRTSRGFALAGLVGLGALAVWWFSAPKSTPQPRVVPLTTYSGVVRWPSFSPDGSQIAFAWNGEPQGSRQLYIQMVSGGPPRCLTKDGISGKPAWSPDGSRIAFPRNGSAYLISPFGQPERKLTDEAGSVDWMPDGKSLLIASSRRMASLYLVSAETGEKKALTTPPSDPSETGKYAHPAVSPNGRQVAFVRYRLGIGRDIFVLPIKDGTPSGSPWRLTRDDAIVEGLAWTPDGREIVFSSNRAGRRSLWRILATSGSDPVRIAGTDEATYPALAKSRSTLLAFQRMITERNVWRMKLPESNHPAGAPSRILASKGDDFAPQFSPDGNRIAFVSARSGSMEIWVCNSDGSQPARLTSFQGRQLGVPRWSPDGQRIVFNAMTDGNMDIWVMNADGGQLRRLTYDPAFEARGAWSRDGRWIYFRSNKSGNEQIWKMPSGGGVAVQITMDGGWEAYESFDGRLLYYAQVFGIPAQGIWSVPVNGGPAQRMVTNAAPNFWGVANSGIYYLDFPAARNRSVPLTLFEFERGKTSRLAAIENLEPGSDPSLAVSPDGRWVAWAQFDRFESNLMMLESYR